MTLDDPRRFGPLVQLSIADMERIASELVPSNAWDFYRTGAREELTLAANLRAWSSYAFVPRVLMVTQPVQTAVEVLGVPLAAPLIVAPMSLQRLAHPDGELAVARAVAKTGSLMIVSIGTSVDLEELAAVPGLRWWLQLYAFRDRDLTKRLLKRAVGLGASAVVLTVDAVGGAPQRWPKGGLIYPPGVREALVESDIFSTGAEWQLDWAYVRWLQETAGVRVVVKGVMHPDDALRAADEGMGAVVVSNHGGRTLDGALATAHALPDVTAATKDRIPVLVDGGIRRGADILRARALGAAAAVVGRPILWGLAVGGAEGVEHVLRRLMDEAAADAALAGVPDLRAVPRELVRRIGVCHQCGEVL